MQNPANKYGISPELLERIIGLFRQFKVEKAVMFGSRARGDFTDASDIGIAFWGKVDEPKLWLAVEQLPTTHKIDLVNYDTLANGSLKQNILRDAVSMI